MRTRPGGLSRLHLAPGKVPRVSLDALQRVLETSAEHNFRHGRVHQRHAHDGDAVVVLVILLDQQLHLVLVRSQEDDVAEEDVTELDKVGEVRNGRSPEEAGGYSTVVQ